MGTVSRGVVTVLGGIVLATGIASPASAGCADLSAGRGHGRLVPAAYRTGGATPGPMVVLAADDDASIVGMWQFAFASDGNDVAPFFIPDGAPLDAGYAQWHSDGTEIMNSSRDPVTSSFCLGVWASVGHRTYKLNHFALSWDNTGQFCTPKPGATNCLVGPANIREEVAVDARGNTYAGTVTIDQYDDAQHLLFHLNGKVTARRVSPD
jgi:hypothetical protein